MFGHFVETRRNLIHMPPGDYLTFPHLAPNKFSKTKKKKKKEKKEELTWEQNTLYLTRLQNWSRRTGGGRTEEEENKKKKTDGNERLTAQQGHFWRDDAAALHLTLRSLFMLHLNIGLRHFIKGLTLFLCFTLGGDRLKETGWISAPSAVPVQLSVHPVCLVQNTGLKIDVDLAFKWIHLYPWLFKIILQNSRHVCKYLSSHCPAEALLLWWLMVSAFSSNLVCLSLCHFETTTKNYIYCKKKKVPYIFTPTLTKTSAFRPEGCHVIPSRTAR